MNVVECVSLNPTIDVASECSSVQPTHKIRLEEQSIYPGGGAVNVVRVIKSMGGQAKLSCLAGGATGSILTTGLDKMGIDYSCIDSAADTRIAFNVFDKTSGIEYRFVPKGASIADSAYEQIIEKISTASPEYLVLSGSLAQGASTDIYARIASNAKAKGALVFVDCSGEALARTLESKSVFLVKPSLSELEQLAGKSLNEHSAIAFASTLVNTGSAVNVAVSMGNNGAFLVNKDGVMRAPALKVHVKSAVGAGDSFLAAMVFKLTRKDSMKNALRCGIAAGAAAVTTKGTRLCEITELNRLISQVQITEHQ